MNYTVSLWPGSGYGLYPVSVNADCEEQAIEKAACEVIRNEAKSFYLTEHEYEAYLNGLGIDEEQDEYYMYVDATMEGAPFPVYLMIMNAKIIAS